MSSCLRIEQQELPLRQRRTRATLGYQRALERRVMSLGAARAKLQRERDVLAAEVEWLRKKAGVC